ncbi:Thoeris anti-defense Tad2 family protein [Yersinia ruckeri]|uniref:Thoeris anti-defense Tad2 family protein n=1 Tax=Yersinia ruckeri TaxID=29486 RepID=UPI002238AA78|nr:hypothetical protein [Yersinia ruckeri]MCW6598845.1 hypothetical protein [Yersinia ruckeri]
MKISTIVAAIEHATAIGNSFTDAFQHMLNGGSVSRNDWPLNESVGLKPGAHSFDGNPDLVHYIDNIPRELFESWSPGIVTRLPSFTKMLSNGSAIDGWTPNTEDLLARDWILH